MVAPVLKQNPDLCGYLGFWSGQDIGMAAAVVEAGDKRQVFTTSSIAAASTTCQLAKRGALRNYLSYHLPEIAHELGAVVTTGLEQNLPAGQSPFANYGDGRELTAATFRPEQCWTLEDWRRRYHRPRSSKIDLRIVPNGRTGA